jgi:hypothetical protein
MMERAYLCIMIKKRPLSPSVPPQSPLSPPYLTFSLPVHGYTHIKMLYNIRLGLISFL